MSWRPAALFDELLGQPLPKVPSAWEDYRRLRQCPGGAVHDAAQGVWVAAGWDAVTEALVDGRHFSSSIYAPTLGQLLGPTLLCLDGAAHRRQRRLIAQALAEATGDGFAERVVLPAASAMVDRFRGEGRADLVRDLAFPLPMAVLADLLAVDNAALQHLHRAAIELVNPAAPERAMAASAYLGQLFGELTVARRSSPGPDLVSRLGAARLDGEGLADDEIVAFLRLLAPAAVDTPFHGIANVLFALLSDSTLAGRLAADPSGIPGAVEEGLRWMPPVTSIARRAQAGATLRGVGVEAGTPVIALLAAANLDPGCFEEPEALRPDRPKAAAHLSFGAGPHKCMGADLGRAELGAAVAAAVALPNLRLAIGRDEVPLVGGYHTRYPQRLPVLFDVS